MAHHARTNNPGANNRRYMIRPQWPARPRSYSSILRGQLLRVLGSPYDRDPCPHALQSHDQIDDPRRPGDIHRRRTRTTQAPCERPGTHRSSQVEAERWHATADGRVWH